MIRHVALSTFRPDVTDDHVVGAVASRVAVQFAGDDVMRPA